jgi:hypothetical protein
MCVREKETSHRIFCECKAVASKRLRQLEFTLVDPGEYHDDLIKNVANFIESTGLLSEYIKLNSVA